MRKRTVCVHEPVANLGMSDNRRSYCYEMRTTSLVLSLALLLLLANSLSAQSARANCPRRPNSRSKPSYRRKRPRPRAPRKLLIFDRNVDYGGHGSIPYANHAFTSDGRTDRRVFHARFR